MSPTWPGGDVRALLATLFLSRGTPMLTAGDEFGRTQAGNNNAYAQDNATDLARLGEGRPAPDRLYRRAGGTSPRACTLLPRSLPHGQYGALRASRMPNGSAPTAGRWHGSPSWRMCWASSSRGAKRLALVFNRSTARRPSALPRRDGHRWTRLFCSAEGEAIPPASVSAYAEERISRSGVADEDVRRLRRPRELSATGGRSTARTTASASRRSAPCFPPWGSASRMMRALPARWRSSRARAARHGRRGRRRHFWRLPNIAAASSSRTPMAVSASSTWPPGS